MPFLRFDLIEGRSDEDLRILLDATHAAMLAAFRVPPKDRYQVVHEHKRSRMIVEDTGLQLERTKDVVMLQITTRPRSRGSKEKFYQLLVERLGASCGIAGNDIIVNFVTNTDEDWSFGLGRAQFLTGEL
jgi:hypothetical protein